MLKTLCFHSKGHGFNSWLGNQDPTCCMRRGQKTKKKISYSLETLSTLLPEMPLYIKVFAKFLVFMEVWPYTEFYHVDYFYCKSHFLKPVAATAAAKSFQSCPTLCDPIDGSPPGSPVPGTLQARTLEWVAISFSLKPVTPIEIPCRW